MALVSLRQLLDHAAEHNYAFPAFNVNNMEQMLAIMAAADATDSPVIMQASRGARAFANDIVLSHLIRAAIELYPHIPVCMHQDHGNSPATCMSAITNGFSSVMMDGSLQNDGKTPADFVYNVAVTAKVTEMAHLVGVSVEGELGHLGSLETGKGEGEQQVSNGRGQGGEGRGDCPIEAGGDPPGAVLYVLPRRLHEHTGLHLLLRRDPQSDLPHDHSGAGIVGRVRPTFRADH